MKRMMMAAVAAGMACMAQAVTVSWNTESSQYALSGATGATKGGTHASGSANFSAGIGDASKWAIHCVITVSDVTLQAGTWPVLVGFGGTSNDPRLYANGNTGAITVTGGSAGFADAPTGVTLADGTFDFVFSHDSDGTMTFYLNGAAVQSFTTTSDSKTILWGAQGTKNYLDATATWEVGDLGFIAGKTYDDALVPEPTALALLALGVAGVALRRRAA